MQSCLIRIRHFDDASSQLRSNYDFFVFVILKIRIWSRKGKYWKYVYMLDIKNADVIESRIETIAPNS